MCFVGHSRLTEYQNSILISRTDKFIGHFASNWFREVDTTNFSRKSLVKRDIFNSHVGRFDVWWSDGGHGLALRGLYILHSVVGKPTDPSPAHDTRPAILAPIAVPRVDRLLSVREPMGETAVSPGAIYSRPSVVAVF